MIAALLLGLAVAAPSAIYVNGVKVDRLPVIEMKGCTVKFDAQGAVWIEAPGYKVQVESLPTAAVAPLPTSGAPFVPSAAAPPVEDTWWLVTEDDGSTGQTVQVEVNGTLVRTVRSGDTQVLVDLSAHIRRGNNELRFTAASDAAIAGGNLTIYVGNGSAGQDGVVRLESPPVRYQRSASAGLISGQRVLTLNIP